jgi:endonuclease/exonuclease/phosphatase (EEP) superfamily protein YafD
VVPSNQERHRSQIEALTALVNEESGPTVVLGDFNATPFSLILKRFERGTGLRRLTALASWPSHVQLPQVAIDHIFVSPDIEASAVRLGAAGGSDHYPVIADLIIPQGRPAAAQAVGGPPSP